VIYLVYAILYLLLGIILLILFLLLLVLLLPIQYRAQGQLQENYHLSLRVGCGFLYRAAADIYKSQRVFSLRLLGIRIPMKSRSQPQKSDQVKAKSRKTSRPSSSGLKSVLNRELFREALNLLTRSFHHIKPSRFYLQGCYGFEEPHFTAWMLPLIGLVNGWDSVVQIDLLPVWDEACVDMELDIQGRIVPAALLLFILRLLISKPVRRIIKEKWKKQK